MLVLDDAQQVGEKQEEDRSTGDLPPSPPIPERAILPVAGMALVGKARLTVQQPSHFMSDSPISPPSPGGWRLDHSYAQLPAAFYSRIDPTPVREPKMIIFNRPLAE